MKHRILTISEILRHPQTPWYVRIAAACVIAYAASPIDLIPDFIPVLGYLDDLILLPLGIALVIRLTPAHIRIAAVRSAIRADAEIKGRSRWVAAMVVVFIWLCVLALIVWRIFK